MRSEIRDVRELIERLEELEEEVSEAYVKYVEDFEPDEDHPMHVQREQWEDGEPDAEELKSLKSFLEDLAGSGGDHKWRGDWYPVTLIPEHSFKEYAEQLAEEIGAINADAAWPANCIDWDEAARQLQIDYSQADWDGVTFYYRS